ncbi:APC family permease [Actinoplanes missouriensis]|uniref:APC family permease n=1 Tax=Actinoplanes missouriensis TaxID=1866 RepID=UPI0002D7E23C|nr:APC family permease [Actinoplanes missouriensis]
MDTPEDDPRALATGRIGVASVSFFGLAAAAPVVTLITLVPVSLAAGSGPLVPLSFAALAVLLVLFCGGYAAMIRRLPSAGAAYTHVARGLGRPAGLAAAWLALAGYQAIQFGLYALAGAAATPLARSWFATAGAEWTVPWWAGAAACWALVALLGTMRIEVAAGVAGLLAVAEAAVLVGVGASNLLAPAGGRITAESIRVDAATIDRPVLGLLLAAGVLAFAGFESAGVYAEEALRPRRTAGFGAYGAVVLIALLLGGLSWSMIVAAGPDRITAVAGARGGDLLFALAGERLLPWAVTTARVILVVGVLAGVLALHHAMARHLHAMGREGVLPSVLAGAGRRTGAPRAASLTQTLAVGAALAGAYAAGADPGPVTARWMILGGALSILLLLLVTALAALLHLNRAPGGESAWGRFVSPLLSTVSLGSLVYLAFRDLPEILGLPAGYPLVRAVPAAIGGCVVLGLAHAALVRWRWPERYAGIGLCGTAVVVTPYPKIPEQRTPGAHRPERVEF